MDDHKNINEFNPVNKLEVLCYKCKRVMKLNKETDLAQCPYCSEINKVKKLVYFDDKVFRFDNMIKNSKNHNNDSNQLPLIGINNKFKENIENEHKDELTYNEYINNQMLNYHSFNKANYQPRPYLDNSKGYFGNYYPYLPPPKDYQWHEEMSNKIRIMNKINNLQRKLRKEYDSKCSVLDHYTLPKVLSYKTLFDTHDEISKRRERTYRDILRGDYSYNEYSYKDLINLKKCTSLY